MNIKVFGRAGSTYMKTIKRYVDTRQDPSRTAEGAVNYGLQGSKLSEYLQRFPFMNRLPILNHKQNGSKYDAIHMVKRALEVSPAYANAFGSAPDSCRVPISFSHPEQMIPLREDGTWILKPYWSLGGRDIEPYTGQAQHTSRSRRYFQQRIHNRRYELRVHCWKWVNDHQWIFQKRIHEDGENQLTWNHHTGGRFVTVREPFDPLHDRVRWFTHLIMNTLGYQFGACDFIIQNVEDGPLATWFLEWNLAPGFTLPHVKKAYCTYIAGLQQLTPAQFKKILEPGLSDQYRIADSVPIYNTERE